MNYQRTHTCNAAALCSQPQETLLGLRTTMSAHAGMAGLKARMQSPWQFELESRCPVHPSRSAQTRVQVCKLFMPHRSWCQTSAESPAPGWLSTAARDRKPAWKSAAANAPGRLIVVPRDTATAGELRKEDRAFGSATLPSDESRPACASSYLRLFV